MSKGLNNNLPKYIEDLLELSRSNIEKLIAAWDGLNEETQIGILTILQERITNNEYRGTPNFSYLHTKIFKKGSESSNDYVRYLSVRYLTSFGRFDDEEGFNKLIKKVNKDGSELVRSAQFEHSIRCDIGDDFFVKQTHQERLARVRSGHLNGDLFAEELTKAVESNYFSETTKEIELLELLDEYLSNDENNANYYEEDFGFFDGFRDSDMTKELEALWNVIPKLPNLAGELMVNKLPHEAPMGSELFKGILNDLTNEQLEQLLDRKDVVAREFRKEVFWRDKIQNEDEFAPYTQFWAQACSYHFKLNDKEFEKILSLPSKEQQSRLECLSWAKSLELYQYLAIIQLITKFVEEPWHNWSIKNALDSLEKRINQEEKRINQEPDYSRESQLIKLRLYNLAYESRNWRNLDSDDLYTAKEVLYPFRIEDDFWKTFLAFLEAFKKSKLTLEDLPRTEYEGW